MKRLLIIAAALAALVGSAHAEQYIRTPNGYVTPKHECGDAEKCVDCTFLSRDDCYAQADAAGLVDKNAPVTHLGPRAPLDFECGQPGGSESQTTRSIFRNSAKLICPVEGAVAVAAPAKPRPPVAGPWFPADDSAGDAAVGIFFAQFCPGYITEDSRRLMHTLLRRCHVIESLMRVRRVHS